MVELHLNDSQMRDFENRLHVISGRSRKTVRWKGRKGELNLISDSMRLIQNDII